MAKSTKNRASTTVNPVTAETTSAKQPAQPAKKEKVRTPAAHWRVTVGDLKKGERCNALEWPLTETQKKALRFKFADVCVLDGRAQYKFGQKQFVSPSAYNSYMADRYTFLSGLYGAVAQEYRDNPETDVWISSAERNKERAEQLALDLVVLEKRNALMEQMLESVGDAEKLAALQAQLAQCTVENVRAELEAEKSAE